MASSGSDMRGVADWLAEYAEEAARTAADPNNQIALIDDSSSSEYEPFSEAVAATAAANPERGGSHPPGATRKRKRKKRSGATRLKRCVATHTGIEEMAKANGLHLVAEQAAITVSRYEEKRAKDYRRAFIARKAATLSDLIRAGALEEELQRELNRHESEELYLPKPRGSIAEAPMPEMWRPVQSCFIPPQTQYLSPPPRPSQAWPQPPLADSPQTPTFPSSPAEARDLAGLRYLRGITPPFKGPPPLKGPPPSKGPPPFKGPPPRPCLKQVGPRPSSNRAAHSQW